MKYKIHKDQVTNIDEEFIEVELETTRPAPEPGYTTTAKLVRIIDGDTYEFEFIRRCNIRLLDIDVYEKNTAIGQEASDFAHKVLSNANEIIIHMPTNDPLKFLDWNSFERVLANVYVDGQNLEQMLRDKNFDKK